MNKDNIIFILVRPNFLGNIGSTARVMKNFGFSQLRLVNPPRNYLDAEARKMAVDAFDVLKKAKIEDSLSQALSDINLAFSTSACQHRTEEPEALGHLVSKIEEQDLTSNNKIAFVFGDERDGLTREEIARCHELILVPTEPTFASLNLAQALGIVAYELSRSSGLVNCRKATTSEILPNGREEDELMQLTSILMDRANFSRRYNRELVTMQLRSALQKMRPNKREFDLLRGFLLRLNDKLEQGQPEPKRGKENV
ncbi:MAG: TrmH family RNA methyltransferase [Candidatus Obscuribacterales bacterium]|jgi:TrmH family RNA methyltransferase